MKLTLDIQRVSESQTIPTDEQFTLWASTALRAEFDAVELTIRIVDVDEMTSLNKTYRKKEGPTNVLSFPFEQPDGITLEMPLLGDVVVCADVVETEASSQHKTIEAHWAHLVIHGCLHLLGHDHIHQNEAEMMESLEIALLKELGFSNPYAKEEE